MAEAIRVAQILGRMDSGGIETVALNYWRHMDRSRVQFDFYFDERSVMPCREELLRGGAGLYPLPPYSHPLQYHEALRRALRAKGYRIAHAHLSTMSVFALFAAYHAGVPVRICHNHSTAHWGEGAKTALKYALRPLAGLFATERFACGEAAGRWLYGGKRFDAGGVTVIPNAIDTARYAYDEEARRRLRAQMGIPQDAYVLGHVGRFMYQKNHRMLLAIFAELLKRRPDALLLLVGEGELEASLRARVKETGLADRVIFAGVRRDADKLYSAMDAFCLPSFYEGMPLVAWEAQANGLPCVFSEAVTREAQCRDAAFLPLSAPPARWASALLAGERGMGAHPPDIRLEAARLQEIYIALNEGGYHAKKPD